MANRPALIPGQRVPDFSIETVNHGLFALNAQAPENFTLVVFFRGLHCPFCARYLSELQDLLPEFDALGIDVVAITSDTAERAARAVSQWKLDALKVGHSFALDAGREWGLYVSGGIGKTSAGVEEPTQFLEPGMFLVRPDVPFSSARYRPCRLRVHR